MTEQNNNEPKQDFAELVQQQIVELKQDVLGRLEKLKAQFPLTQSDLTEIKDLVKEEVSTVIQDVTQVSQDVKQEITDISNKHKDQLASIFKRSKDHTMDALNKINLSQPKDTPED